MSEENTFLGYVREDGRVGTRRYALALPSVVCAMRAAARAAAGIDGAVAVEHPVGCAQIGADREQTKAVLVGMGSHPNVRGTVVLGLGCEGVPAAEVGDGIRALGGAAEVVTIQESGGTDQAAAVAAGTLAGWAAEPADRRPASAQTLLLGVGRIEALGARGRQLVDAFLELGGRVIALDGPESWDRWPYGRRVPLDRARLVMASEHGASQAITGLAAAGAQVIVEQADAHYLGGHPLVPVIRIGYDDRLQAALRDDMDGMMAERDIDGWIDWILRVAGGEPTAAERMGAATFAIDRIGPTL